jgi:hypothetical protein
MQASGNGAENQRHLSQKLQNIVQRTKDMFGIALKQNSEKLTRAY